MATYIGLDVHKRTCHATVLQDGEVFQERFANTPEELRRFLSKYQQARIAMEATYCWQPAYDLAESLGHEVHLAHPKETRLVAKRRIKTDARDSEALARLLELGWLPEAYVPPKPIRELRELLRLHARLTCESTRMKNRIHAELAKAGIELGVHPFTRQGRRLLRELGNRNIHCYLGLLEAIEDKLREAEREIRRRAEASDDARLLMTIPGVGHYSALLITATIADIDRFPGPEELCSYAGIVPSVEQSGNHAKHGPITKEGSRLLRWVLIQCAWMHLMHARDSRLKRFYRRLARRKGKPVAVVAMARKLLVTIYWMLKRRESFRS